ncbi:MAG: YwaF family protein [Lachnospiraceae bacterium]|nr:YwaF family protein [Lachnospiraceae bacterium]
MHLRNIRDYAAVLATARAALLLCEQEATFTWMCILECFAQYRIQYQIEHFNWWEALPLQLCYVGMILTPVAIYWKKDFLLAFCAYIVPLGAIMALVFPDPLFRDFSLLEPRLFLFYLLHILIIVSSISLITLGLFQPTFRVIPMCCIAMLVLTFLIHIVNVILRNTVCSYANYFYTFPEDISILNFFWKLLPLPFVYEIPLLAILGVWACSITFFYKLLAGCKKSP